MKIEGLGAGIPSIIIETCCFSVFVQPPPLINQREKDGGRAVTRTAVGGATVSNSSCKMTGQLAAPPQKDGGYIHYVKNRYSSEPLTKIVCFCMFLLCQNTLD